MDSGAWIALFRRIPPTQQDSLTLMTATGIEIVLQRVLRLERDFMVVKGRQSGSTDQAQMHVLPYDQVVSMTFTRKMSDVEMMEAIGSPSATDQLPVENEVALSPPAHEDVEPNTAKSSQVAQPTTAPVPVPAPKTAMPSKSVLLARLRQRLASDSAKPGDPKLP